MIQALCRALLRDLLVFPQEGGQLQLLQMMLEQDAGGSAMAGGQQGGVVGAAGGGDEGLGQVRIA